MNEISLELWTLLVSFSKRIVGALVVYFIGRFIINRFLSGITKTRFYNNLDSTVKSFTLNACKILLHVLLVISIIGILGVPMASIITVLASVCVAIGMALQGSLSNLAGGIMLLVMRPFNVGDYISSNGGDGTVKEVNLFYTVLTTVDNKRITIPNGSLMNASITNYSSEPTRRVDINLSCAKNENTDKVLYILQQALHSEERVLEDPAPVARLLDTTNEALNFTARVWVRNDDYWEVYFNLMKKLTDALREEGIQSPAIRVLTESSPKA